MSETCEAKPRGRSPAEREARLRLCKSLPPIFSIIKLKQELLASLKCRYQLYHWHIATFHVYKKIKDPKKTSRASNISYISDKLNKSGMFKKIYLTKEYCQDGSVHFHGLLASKSKDEKGFVQHLKIPSIPNVKIWSKYYDPKCRILYQPDNEDLLQGELSQPHYWVLGYDDTGANVDVLESIPHGCADLGFKHRWMEYGLQRYLLYMTKGFGNGVSLYKEYYYKA